MVSWRIGRDHLAQLVDTQSPPTEAFLTSLTGRIKTRISGTVAVLSANAQRIPAVLERQIQRFQVLEERVVLVTVVTEHVPRVAAAHRIAVEELGHGVARVLLYYGFKEVPRVPRALGQALEQLGIAVSPHAVVYLIGRETLVVTRKGRMGRFTEPVFALLSRNARSVTDDFSIPVAQVVELGMQADL
jgi:KUP system potassium uptake protein